jgi:hypothetical protein
MGQKGNGSEHCESYTVRIRHLVQDRIRMFLGLPGFGSISQRFGSGSFLFLKMQNKILTQSFCKDKIFKTVDNVPAGYKKKYEKLFFASI